MPPTTNVNNISNTLYSIDEAVPKQLKVNKTTRNHRKFHNEMHKIRQIEMEYINDLQRGRAEKKDESNRWQGGGRSERQKQGEVG